MIHATAIGLILLNPQKQHADWYKSVRSPGRCSGATATQGNKSSKSYYNTVLGMKIYLLHAWFVHFALPLPRHTCMGNTDSFYFHVCLLAFSKLLKASLCPCATPIRVPLCRYVSRMCLLSLYGWSVTSA